MNLMREFERRILDGPRNRREAVFFFFQMMRGVYAPRLREKKGLHQQPSSGSEVVGPPLSASEPAAEEFFSELGRMMATCALASSFVISVGLCNIRSRDKAGLYP